MPTYEYRCNACGHLCEFFQSMSEDAKTECPECHKHELERLISGGNFVLKGDGWYKDLYSSPKPKSEGSKDSGSSSTPAAKSSSGGGSSDD